MSPEQEAHAEQLVKRFSDKAIIKYRKGCEEHLGNLWEVPLPDLLNMLEEELIDAWMYLETIKELTA